MAKLLTILSLILVLLLFPPAALALISNNAVPGDATYPIKRGLEDVIFAIASINPVTKAWFSAARSDRRFQEFNILITQGKQADKTLNELVEQTQTTANQIVQISDRNQKAQLVEKLSESIKKYDKGLEEIGKVSTAPVFTETPAPTIKPTYTPRPTVTPTPHPTSTPQPSPSSPPPPPPSECEAITDPIERARCELQRIHLRLGATSLEEFPETRNRRGRDQDKDSERGERRDRERRGDERENERDNLRRDSDRENNGNREQNRER